MKTRRRRLQRLTCPKWLRNRGGATMLTQEENDLTRTGRDTPMGRMMRRFWLPVASAHQVAEPDGAPLRTNCWANTWLYSVIPTAIWVCWTSSAFTGGYLWRWDGTKKAACVAYCMVGSSPATVRSRRRRTTGLPTCARK